MRLKDKANRFLNCKNIAVIGVSISSPEEAVNYNYRKLKKSGYNVFPVNPNHSLFEGEKCYHHISEIENGVDAALIFTSPEVTPAVLDECIRAKINNIWIHRSFGNGSCSVAATEIAKNNPDINFIDGACPMMFIEGADWAHKCIKLIMKISGRLPN